MRLAKGAKETFGWVILGKDRDVIIPPKAWDRYGFQVEEEAIFIPGSKKSGGFGLTTRKLQTGLSFSINENRILGYSYFTSEAEVRIPENIPINPGERLLTVFGSGYALGFISQGPIYEEAKQHPDIDEAAKE
jgi:hypothetical protein